MFCTKQWIYESTNSAALNNGFMIVFYNLFDECTNSGTFDECTKQWIYEEMVWMNVLNNGFMIVFYNLFDTVTKLFG